MKYSYNWIKELSGTKKSAKEIAELFLTHSFEVEGIERLSKNLEKVVIGKVLQVEKHPNADKLNIAQVDVGKDNGGILQIICGAPNLKIKQKVPVALVGAKLPHPKEKFFEIKESKIRGIKSYGMICAEDELGIGDDHQGIMVLDQDAPVGESFVKFLNLDDQIIDIDILPNRAHDCLSYWGVAKELMTLEKYFNNSKNNIENAFRVKNYLKSIKAKNFSAKLETKNCLRYIGVEVDNVRIDSSPQWLKTRLLASEIKPINNIVDITNYVMLLTGQPMHVFDADVVSKIVVRQAKEGEKIKLLDENVLKLRQEDIVITDGQKPIALAGIMGGLDSSVSKRTRRIILESANFDSVSIRKTKSFYNIQTESAYRFERKIDPNIADDAINEALMLLQEIVGGKIISYNDIYPEPITKWKINLKIEYVERLLGLNIAQKTIEKILKNLGIFIIKKNNNLICEIPTERIDLKTEEDLIEEIGRIYGYNKIKPKPLIDTIQVPYKNKQRFFERLIKDILVGNGFDEVKTYSFYSKNNAQVMGLNKKKHLSLINPLNPNQELVRQTLLSGVLDACKKSLSYYKDIFIFDIGKVYIPERDRKQNKEKLLLNLAVASFEKNGEQFFVLKESLESLFKKINLNKWHYDDNFKDEKNEFFHSARRALIRVDDKVVGIIGEVNKKILKYFGIKNVRVSISEIDLGILLQELTGEYFYSSLARFPSIERDLSIIVKEKTKVSEVENLLLSKGGRLVEKVEMIDLYVNSEGERSLTFRIIFSHPNRTLTSEEVDTQMNKIMIGIEDRLGAKIRK